MAANCVAHRLLSIVVLHCFPRALGGEASQGVGQGQGSGAGTGAVVRSDLVELVDGAGAWAGSGVTGDAAAETPAAGTQARHGRLSCWADRSHTNHLNMGGGGS